ncbi:MAG TPA: gliding motility-associated C-terminal domain-containing protein, partial [Bacteroidia bacterium]|nr:gliding motility-associated C-terminal domain-containing protein [Bacteroidia bacterium]
GITASSLCPGVYTGYVTGSNGCQTSSTYTVTQPSALSSTPAQTNILCAGSTGTATINVSGGTTGYTYVWSPAPAGGQGSPTATGLTAGVWSCISTDAKGCTTTQTYTITAPAALAVTPSQTNLNCSSSTNGTAVANVTGGTPGYTYVWSPAPTGGQGTNTATSLTAGIWTCTITDANTCTTTQTYTITAPAALTSAQTSTNLTCNAICAGIAKASPSGGTPGYTYVWSPAPGAGQGTDSASTLCAGTYICTITDANGCTTAPSFTITQPAPITATTASTTANCGVPNGSATVTASGGTPGPGYTYTWNPIPTGGQGTPTATGLTAGNWTCTVVDGRGCSAQIIVAVNNSGGPSVTAAKTNPVCFGSCNGSITVTPSGGLAPYTYTWNTTPVNNTNTASALCAGIYTCAVYDANNCLINRVDTIKTPTALVVAPTQTNVSCNGICNGKAIGNVSGGTPGYTFAWTGNASTTDSATGLCTGSYTLNITDGNGCPSSQIFTITQPNALAANPTTTNITCNGSNNGQACVAPSGGTSAYTYNWVPAPPTGQGTTCASGLAPGTSTCVITDAHGCIDSATFTLTQPPVLTASTTSTNATCSQNNGQANAAGAGGTPAYSYAWSSGPTTPGLTNLSPGIYTCIVKDNNGCSSTVIDTITNTGTMPVPAILTVSTGIICQGDSALLTASGGGVGCTYTWNPGGSNADSIYAKVGATYTLTATNPCGTVTTNKVINVITVPNPTVAGASVFCPGKSDTLTASATPVTVPATTYTWNTSPPTVSSTLIVNTAGNYTVTATNQCSSTSTIVPVSTYNILAEFGASTYSGFTPLPVNFLDSSSATAVSWMWNFGDGTSGSGLNPTHTYTNGGTYTIVEIIKDSHGCISSDTIQIHVTDLPSWIQVPNIFTPNGDGDNDEWAVRYQGISSFNAKVYDRWGVMMSELLAPGQGWDGHTASGAAAVNGTYYYIITAKGDDGKDYAFEGYLMLIRN